MHRAPIARGRDLPAHISAPDSAYHVGVQAIKLEQSEAVERHLDDVRTQLRAALDAGSISAKDLINLVIDRDRVIAQVGRDVANGKHANRLLGEVVRGLLALAKTGTPQQIEDTLRSLGNAPVDRRQIRLHGTALGSGQSDEV